MSRKQFLTYLLLGTLLLTIGIVLFNFSTFLPFFKNMVSNVIVPIFIGICIAYILNLVATKLEKLLKKMHCPKKALKPIAIPLAIVLIFATLFLVLGFVVPELFNAVKILITSVTDFISNFEEWAAVHLSDHPEIAKTLTVAEENLTRFIYDVIEKLKDTYPELISYTFSAVLLTAKSLLAFLVSLVFGIYFTASKERISGHITKVLSLILPEKKVEAILHVGRVSNTVFSKYISAQCLEALILGSLCCVGMFIFRLPYAPMVGALTGALALIPIYGAFISAFFGAFMIAVVSPWKGLFFLLFILVLQQAEGNLIYPRVVGSSLGLPSVYVFAAVTVAGALFGIVGMLFAVPVCTIVYRLVKEKYEKEQEKKASVTLGKAKA